MFYTWPDPWLTNKKCSRILLYIWSWALERLGYHKRHVQPGKRAGMKNFRSCQHSAIQILGWLTTKQSCLSFPSLKNWTNFKLKISYLPQWPLRMYQRLKHFRNQSIDFMDYCFMLQGEVTTLYCFNATPRLENLRQTFLLSLSHDPVTFRVTSLSTLQERTVTTIIHSLIHSFRRPQPS